MEVIGKIIHVLPLQSGTSQAGNQWKKQEYVLETEDAYPKKVCFDFFGDRVDQFPLAIGDRVRLNFDIESNIQVGEELRVSFDIDAHEYQGRWYTSIRGWKAEKIDAQAMAASPAPMAAPQQAVPAPPPAMTDFTQSSDTDDLPF